MRKKKNRYPVVNIGTASILTVFVVLAMVTFATLTYMTARKDARFNQQELDSASAWYDAVGYAREQIAEIDRDLNIRYENGTFEQELKETYTFSVPCGEDKVLAVSLQPCRPAENEGLLYRITQFQEVSIKEWSNGGSLNLMDPD